MLENDNEDGEAEDIYNEVVYTLAATYKELVLVIASGPVGRNQFLKGEEKYLRMGTRCV